MKLGDLPLEQSIEAELKIVPIIERIMKDKETAKLFDGIFKDTSTSKKSIMSRVSSAKDLSRVLLTNHLNDVLDIFALLNNTTREKLKKEKRNVINAYIADLLDDPDLISFFMPLETLAKVAQSAT